MIRHVITQHIRKGFSMFLYDFKFDDLSIIAYNALLKYQRNYKVKPTFWVIDFDRIYHRCNPLDPQSMEDITDATEASRTNMLKLDLSQIEQQGDTFFSSLDTAYLIFLIIGIVGYFCVPNVANYVVHAGGGNTILQKVNSIIASSTRSGMQMGRAGGGMAADALGDGYRNLKQSFSSGAQGDYFADNPHQQQRLEGK